VRLVCLALVALAGTACAPARRADPVALIVGRAAADRFCYACHDRETRRAGNPLLPRLDLARFGTPELAYASVGRLQQLSASMTLPFEGPEAERRALATWLADAAQREATRRRAPARLALASALAAAAAGVAALHAARRRR
jgi:hypothetical protein